MTIQMVSENRSIKAAPDESARAGLLRQPTIWIVAWLVIASLTLGYGLLRRYAFDDAQYLILAEELSQGRNPYSYVENKPPGTYAAVAAWFKVLGHNQYSGRVFSWTLMLLTAAVIGNLFPKMILWQRLATGLAAFVLLWFCEGSLLMTEAGVALFAAVGLWTLRRRFESALAQFGAGIAFGLATLFKQPALALPVVMCIVLLAAGVTRRLTWKAAIRAAASHLAGYLSVIGVAIAIFVHLGVAGQIWTRCFAGLGYYERRMGSSEILFLALRVGWFIGPALVIVALRLSRFQILKDDLLFQFSALAGLSQLSSLAARAYAHYVLCAVPFLVVVLWWGTQHFASNVNVGAFWSSKSARLAGAVLAALLMVCVGGAAYLKRATLVRLVQPSQGITPRDLAHELARYAPDAADRALFFGRGPMGYYPVAGYYYSGLRPPGSFFFLLGKSSDPAELDRWLNQLPELISDPAVKVVEFDPAYRFDPYYYPVRDDQRQRIVAALTAHFVHSEEISDPHLWVRAGLTPRSGASPVRGPFAGASR